MCLMNRYFFQPYHFECKQADYLSINICLFALKMIGLEKISVHQTHVGLLPEFKVVRWLKKFVFRNRGHGEGVGDVFHFWFSYTHSTKDV